jgi:phosphatidylinositol-3-phosphatase
MTPDDQDNTTNTSAHRAQSEQCAGCGAALVEDQRYCLQCGARRGLPRLDFSAFWPGLSLTGARPEPEPTRTGDSGGATGGSWFASGWGAGGAPSRRVIGVLVACVLAVGILAGAALGPSPSGSPADAATLAQRAISALIARTSSTPPASATTSSTPTPASEPAATPSSASGKESKAASEATSNSESPESSSGGESSPVTQTSEESPSEGSSKNSGKGEKTTPGTPIKLPAVKHVWVIAFSGTSFKAALADSKVDPYLAKQLVPKGTLLSNYKLSASSSLANGIALLAGQSVNLDTEQNCPTYSELQPPTVNATTGLAEGVGCVYPATVKTLADELSAGALTWKAYVQEMEEGAPTAPAGSNGAAGATTPAGASSTSTTPTATPTAASDTTPATGTAPTTGGVTCRRPELGAGDPNHTPVPGDPYLTYRNPFVYFNSLLSEGTCASNDVDLTQLQGDLATPANTPSLSWIVPSACNDGSSAPCAPGAAAGLAPADSFLKEVVPQILASTAYSKEGLIVIVPDSPPSSPASAAGEPVGALLLSPFVHSGARVSESFNDFSLLKSISLLFGVLPLGHANDPSTVSFGATVYGSSGKTASSAATTAKKAAQAASAAQPRRQAASQTGG